MRRWLWLPAWAAVAGLGATPAAAQFGSILRQATTPAPPPSSDDSADNGGCPKGKSGSSVGRGILGGVLRDVVGDAASKAGVYSYVPISEVSDTLTDAIACRLDPDEQKQAAAATEEVVRGEEVGASSSWTSETRENVSGSSTVVARNDDADGRRCMTVNDFIIVDGEETRVSKRMCKGPGDARYVLAT